VFLDDDVMKIMCIDIIKPNIQIKHEEQQVIFTVVTFSTF